MEDEKLAKLKSKIPDCLFQVPIKALSSQTKDKLKYLDCNFILPDHSIRLRDYRGMAILLGYSTMELNMLIDQKKYTSPTMLILERMSMEKKSIGDLVHYLLQLKRSDIIASIKENCNHDVLSYVNKSAAGDSKNINYEDISRLASSSDVEKANRNLEKLFTTDIIETTNKKIEIYDVFISFDSESVPDIKVMWSLSNSLEENGMTVAKGSYSFFQGCCLIEAFANAIYNRSRKVILLISKAYINSESCLMQLYFARDADKASWRNKVIPFYIENVKKPECIANLNSFRYYDEFMRENFFKDFINNIKHY